MKISAINVYSAQRYSNNSNKTQKNMTPQSFSGRTENPEKVNEYGFVSFSILNHDMSDFLRQRDIRLQKPYSSQEKIAEAFAKNIEDYNENFEPDRYFEKTENTDSLKLYIADPNEVVTEKVKNEHAYIVHDNEPKFPTMEQIRSKYLSESPEPHDYFKDISRYLAYQKRVILADSNNLKTAECHFGLNSDEAEGYTDRIVSASQKVVKARNVLGELNKSGEDFMYRDFLANKLQDLKQKYKTVDIHLKDIEFKKYITDEGIQKNKELLERNSKNFGYYERNGIQGAIRSSIEYSKKLQKEYNEYFAIKQNGPQMIQETQDELNNVLTRLRQNYEDFERKCSNDFE